jgi:hypothetical protein
MSVQRFVKEAPRPLHISATSCQSLLSDARPAGRVGAEHKHQEDEHKLQLSGSCTIVRRDLGLQTFKGRIYVLRGCGQAGQHGEDLHEGT